jgi:hypothetical protein
MKHPNESAADYMRRIVANINSEQEDLLDDLPSIAAIVEFFELWSRYNTDYLEGILECIADGDSPKPLHHFIRKYNLSWKIKWNLKWRA